MTIRERPPKRQPEAIRPGDATSMQAIMQMLVGLSTPITIERKVDERTEKTYFTWQVGEITPEHPVGYGMGATTSFVDALRLSMNAHSQKGNHSSRQEGNTTHDQLRTETTARPAPPLILARGKRKTQKAA